MLKEIFAHIGDTHLWSSGQWSKTARGLALVGAVFNVIDAAHAKGIRTILNGGDAINAVRPSPETVMQLRQIDERLRKLGMVMVMVSGNHDYTGALHWVHVCTDQARNRADGTGIIMVDFGAYKLKSGLTVFGIPGVSAQLIRETNAAYSPCSDIVVAHFTADGDAPFTGDHPTTGDAINAGTKFLAMGDLHKKFQRFERHHDRDVLVVMPGSTSMCSVAEADENYWAEVEVTQDGATFKNWHLIPGCPVLRVDMGDEAWLTVMTEFVTKQDVAGHGVVVVRYDPTKHKFDTARAVAAERPCVVVLPHPQCAEEGPAYQTALVEDQGEPLLPLEAFQKEHRVGVPELDTVVTAVLKRVPQADKMLDDAIKEYTKRG